MTTPIDLLVIEDNPGDIELIRIGFEEARMLVNMTVISDGQDAINFFDNVTSAPDLVLLDISLPKVSGIDILKKIRTTDTCKDIPVVVLTSSDAETDVARSYAAHANSFVTKPVDIDKFLQVIKKIEHFWLTVVKLPQHSTTQPLGKNAI